MTSIRHMQPGIYTALWLMPLLALLQATTFNHIELRGIIPSIMLIVVVDWGILRGVDEAVLWAFLGGLCLDLFSDWPFGTGTISLVVVASVLSLGGGTFIRTHALLPPATVVAATLLYYIVALFLLESTHHPVSWVETLRAVALPAAIYNAVLSLLIYPLVRRLEQRVYPLQRASW